MAAGKNLAQSPLRMTARIAKHRPTDSFREISSAVERFVHIEDVSGSNPLSPTISSKGAPHPACLLHGGQWRHGCTHLGAPAYPSPCQNRARPVIGCRRAVSSVGRASRLHRECRGFESLTAHHLSPVQCHASGSPACAASACLTGAPAHIPCPSKNLPYHHFCKNTRGCGGWPQLRAIRPLFTPAQPARAPWGAFCPAKVYFMMKGDHHELEPHSRPHNPDRRRSRRD